MGQGGQPLQIDKSPGSHCSYQGWGARQVCTAGDAAKHASQASADSPTGAPGSVNAGGVWQGHVLQALGDGVGDGEAAAGEGEGVAGDVPGGVMSSPGLLGVLGVELK